MHIDWSLRALRTFPATLEALMGDVPEQALDWRPQSWEGIPSEKLTIRQQLCHLRDIETDGYLVRFTRLLREEKPALESIDTDALVQSRNYDGTQTEDAFRDFTAAREKTMRILDMLQPSDHARSGYFEGYGNVTVAALIHYLCSHDCQHLSGIQWLLGQHAAARCA